MSDLADAALNYAQAGWKVFPLKPRDKQPDGRLAPRGLHDATSDATKVRQWWQASPEANIGLNCGASGFTAVDLDYAEDEGLVIKDGLAAWSKLQADYGINVQTSTSHTPRGGQHLIFAAPADTAIPNSQGKLAPDIDIRGDGGYIVLPPSVGSNGKAYEWDDGCTAIAPLPDSLVPLLAQPAGPADPWEIFTAGDALKARPPLVWMVDGILEAGSLSVWYGAPGTLKSLLLADLAVSVAAGMPWLEALPGLATAGFGVTAGGVMWADFDNGRRRTHERFGALLRARCLGDHVPLYYVSMPTPHLDAGDPNGIAQLAGRLVDRNIRLLVVDNLGVISGDADENSADMQSPMAGLRWLTEATGAAVAVLHHQRKTNGINTRAGETLRGHGSIEAKLDLAILVSRDDGSVTCTPTKVRGAEVKPFSGRFIYEQDAYKELTEARFWAAQTRDSKAEAKAELEQDILDALMANGPMGANAIHRKTAGQRKVVFATISEMVLAGVLESKPGPRNSTIISVVGVSP